MIAGPLIPTVIAISGLRPLAKGAEGWDRTTAARVFNAALYL
jgi:hypothetical protein